MFRFKKNKFCVGSISIVLRYLLIKMKGDPNNDSRIS